MIRTMSLAESPLLPRPPSDTAATITRGVRRALADRGVRTLVEFSLANNRRADVFGIDEGGEIVIVEVKSSVADFRSDHKWQDYLEYCDSFYFAVGPDFPQELIPEECGLMVADAFGAEVLRESPVTKLVAARRKAVTLRAILCAAGRLHRVEDPGFGM